MKLTIEAVTQKTVKVHGQQMSRDYAEMVLLPLLVSSAGQNEGRIFQIAETFATAGLSLAGSSSADLVYRTTLARKKAEAERLRAEAKAHAARMYEPTREEIAKKKAEREAEAARIRAIGESVRAARGRS